jgi:two-component system, cell cycle response regulator DivK
MASVLIIEDNEVNRDMLSRRLARQGFTVELAFDGQQGLDRAIAMLPDIVLLDMSLPILDGWEVARRLRASERTRELAIIALTAHAMTGDEQKARAAGCDDYDTKPVDMERLLTKMRALLAAKAGGQESSGGGGTP